MVPIPGLQSDGRRADIAEVDLDWWNTRLDRHGIPVHLWGRNADGVPVSSGKAFLSRDDLNGSLPSKGPTDLGVLYRAAAWLQGHKHRGHVPRFVDVRNFVGGTTDFTRITAALQACREQHPANLDHGPYRMWSGWPHAPGVGPTLMSLYCWAVHDGHHRPQLLDKHSLATLCRLGWWELPSVDHFSARRRYVRYCALLHDLADQRGRCRQNSLRCGWRTPGGNAHRAAARPAEKVRRNCIITLLRCCPICGLDRPHGGCRGTRVVCFGVRGGGCGRCWGSGGEIELIGFGQGFSAR